LLLSWYSSFPHKEDFALANLVFLDLLKASSDSFLASPFSLLFLPLVSFPLSSFMSEDFNQTVAWVGIEFLVFQAGLMELLI